MIEDVKTKRLSVHCDNRGHLMEMLRYDDEIFSEFGQVYMTTTYPGVVKAWHFHREQSDNIVCVNGMIKLVLCDTRKDSKTLNEIWEFYIGENNPMLIHVPKGVYHGWICLGDKTAIIINIPDKMYDYKKPDEERIDPHNNEIISYNWRNVDR